MKRIKLPWVEGITELLRDERGASAVEFAIGGPMLILALLAMVDVGSAIGERMDMDRSIRAGAQAAMSLIGDPGVIQGIVEETATSTDGLGVSVDMVCSCAGIGASCTSTCASGDEPSVEMQIAATQTYSGILFRNLALESSTNVSIR
jgi:pilus assembly protein CpaE